MVFLLSVVLVRWLGRDTPCSWIQMRTYPILRGRRIFYFFLFKIDKSVRSQFLIFFEFSIFWRFFSIP